MSAFDQHRTPLTSTDCNSSELNGGQSVVVGVDGSESSGLALRWAAAEAERRHTLLTVVRTHAASRAADQDTGATPTSEDGDILRAAVRSVSQDHPGLQVVPQLLCWPVPYGLKAAARGAALVVVGAGSPANAAAGVRHGSVATAVIDNSAIPAVIVHPYAAARSKDGPVLVGLDGSHHSSPALTFAFSEAKLRGVSVVVVTSRLRGSPSHAPHSVTASCETDASLAEQEDFLVDQIEFTAANYPSVTIIREITEGPAELAVRETAARHSAAMIVVGARGVLTSQSSSLGPTVRALLLHAPCPVAVVRHLS